MEKMLIVYAYEGEDRRPYTKYKYIEPESLYREVFEISNELKTNRCRGDIYALNDKREVVAEAHVRKKGA